MTTIGMHYDVLPGKEAEFEEGFQRTIEQLKSVAGHVESHLYARVGTLGSYLILSRWETELDFQTFLRSETFKQVTSWGRAEILRGRPRHQIFNER